MNLHPEYRTGDQNDLQELKELGLITFGQYADQLDPEHWNTLHNNLQNEERLSELINIARCFVCVHNDKIIGRAFLVPQGHPTPIFEKEWAQIRMVGVHPDYAGKGLQRN